MRPSTLSRKLDLGAAIEQNRDFSVTIWHNAGIRQIKKWAPWHSRK
jgi:hypothetical protein